MAKFVAIVGESGTGKSTSIKSLDPKSTYIINVAGKELPFKGSNKLYNVENKNYYEPSSAQDALEKLRKVSEKATHIKDIILEDSNYLMSFNLIHKALETGFTKFSIMAKDLLNLIQDGKKLRDDLIIYYFTHSEPVFDGEDVVRYKIKTSGKAIDSQIVLEGLFTIVIYTYVETKGDKTTFQFLTNKLGKFPAKTPSEMFEDLKIPNDLQIVSDKIREYYS